jgi:hypothetical protein
VVVALAVAGLLVVGILAAATYWLLAGSPGPRAPDEAEPSALAAQADRGLDAAVATQGLAEVQAMFSRIASPQPDLLPDGVAGMSIEVTGSAPPWPGASKELSLSTLSQVGLEGRAFLVLAPTDVLAGEAFPVTVTAIDAEGTPDPAFGGSIVLTGPGGEDAYAVHDFTASDAGTWETEFTVDRPGVTSIAAVQVGETNTTGASGPILVHSAREATGGPRQSLNVTFGASDTTRIEATLAAVGVTVEIRLWCHPGGIELDAFGMVVHSRPSQTRSCLEQSGGDGFASLGIAALAPEPTSATLRNGTLEAGFRGGRSTATVWMQETPDGWRVQRLEARAGGLNMTLRPLYGPRPGLELPVADLTAPAQVAGGLRGGDGNEPPVAGGAHRQPRARGRPRGAHLPPLGRPGRGDVQPRRRHPVGGRVRVHVPRRRRPRRGRGAGLGILRRLAHAARRRRPARHQPRMATGRGRPRPLRRGRRIPGPVARRGRTGRVRALGRRAVSPRGRFVGSAAPSERRSLRLPNLLPRTPPGMLRMPAGPLAALAVQKTFRSPCPLNATRPPGPSGPAGLAACGGLEKRALLAPLA